MTEPETDAVRRQREADPFIIGLTQHALETADTKRLADLIEWFLDSDNRAMRDAFILGLARSHTELTPTQYASALQQSGISSTTPHLARSTGTRTRPTHYENRFLH